MRKSHSSVSADYVYFSSKSMFFWRSLGVDFLLKGGEGSGGGGVHDSYSYLHLNSSFELVLWVLVALLGSVVCKVINKSSVILNAMYRFFDWLVTILKVG